MSDQLPDDLELLAGSSEKGIPIGVYLIDPMSFNAFESLEFKGKFKSMPFTKLQKMLDSFASVDTENLDQVDDAYEELMRIFGYLVYQVMKRTNPEAKPEDGMVYITMDRLLTAFVAIRQQAGGDSLGEAPPTPTSESSPATDGQGLSNLSPANTDILPST